MRRLSIFLTFSVFVLAAGMQYKVVKTLPIGGQGGWDYVLADDQSRKLFLSRGDRVKVLDLDTEKSVGEIPDTPGVHGMAVAGTSGKGFITAGRANRVDVFDLKTLRKTGSVPAGTNPDAIAYDPVSNRVFAFNGRSKDATAISVASLHADGTIPLGGKPETGVSDGAGHVYVNIEDTAEIAEIDTKALSVKRRFTIDGCEEPSGLAIDQKHGRLFAGCGNKTMAVVDPHSGKTIAHLPIGEGVDACDFDPDLGYAFASTGDGHITVASEKQPGRFAVVQNVETQRGARTMTVDRKTHRIYTPTARFGPPPPSTPDRPHPYPSILPDTFVVLVVGQQ